MNKKALLLLAALVLPACGLQGVSSNPINLSESFKPMESVVQNLIAQTSRLESSVPAETGQFLDTATQISGALAQVTQILESQGVDINNMDAIYQTIDPAVIAKVSDLVAEQNLGDMAAKLAQSSQDAVMSIETRKEGEEK